MTDFLGSLGVSLQGPVVINADNQGSIALARNPVFHDRSKHIDIQYHFARDLIRAGRISLNGRDVGGPFDQILTSCASPLLVEGYWTVVVDCFCYLALVFLWSALCYGSQQGGMLMFLSSCAAYRLHCDLCALVLACDFVRLYKFDLRLDLQTQLLMR